MLEDDAPPEPAPRPLARTIGRLVAGFLVAVFIGFALAAVAFVANAPVWVGPLVFLVTIAGYFLIAAVIILPPALRQMREAVRNAPSPESVAAATAGESVSAGATTIAGDPRPDPAPTMPDLTTTPGKVLAHQLPRAGMNAAVQFGCAIFVALFWNGIVSVFVYQFVSKWARGGFPNGIFNWLQVLFLLPFVVVGLFLLLAVISLGLRWLITLMVGKLEVEVSVHPLTPGGSSSLHIAQRGLFGIGRVNAALVCTESATYTAGTSRSTATREVFAQPVIDPEENPDATGLPVAMDFRVPIEAMHSFEAPNNTIAWAIRVKGRVMGLLPFGDDYSVVVVAQ